MSEQLDSGEQIDLLAGIRNGTWLDQAGGGVSMCRYTRYTRITVSKTLLTCDVTDVTAVTRKSSSTAGAGR